LGAGGIRKPADIQMDQFTDHDDLNQETDLAAGAVIQPDGGMDDALTNTNDARPGDDPDTDVAPAERQTGTVKFFNEIKGYGFIIPDHGGNDVFVHISAVQRSGLSALDNGIRVSYGTEPDKRGKGPKAGDIKVEP
jgi:cold shock protein